MEIVKLKSETKEKLEVLSKLIPALTLLCYVCGFIVYNTHLAHFGIMEVEIFNLRYIVAGLNFLFLIAFMLGTIYLWPLHLYKNTFRKLISVSFNSFLCFSFYSLFFFPLDYKVNTFVTYLVVILLANITFISLEHLKKEGLNFGDGLFQIVTISFGLLFIFGLSFKHIKRNVGGGQLYKKILILEKPIVDFISLDKAMKTDTLLIIYENDKEIFFFNNSKVCSLKKNLVVAEIMIKD